MFRLRPNIQRGLLLNKNTLFISQYNGRGITLINNSVISIPSQFSSCYSTKIANEQSFGDDEQINKDTSNLKSTSNEPWYLKLGENQRQILKLQENHIKEIIQYPQNFVPSKSLTEISDFLVNKLGLSDIIVFDLSKASIEEQDYLNPMYGKIGKIVILSTALSLKHCHNSYIELNQFLKTKYNVFSTVEGKLNNNELKKIEKRLKRKNIKNKQNHTSNVFDTNESWYMIDCKIEGIIINIMTKKKRLDLNLEELYCPIDEKYKYRNRIGGQNQSLSIENDDLLHNVSPEQNILAGLKRLAHQRRSYSTTANKQTKNDTINNNNNNNKNISINLDPTDFLERVKSSIKELTSETNQQQQQYYYDSTLQIMDEMIYYLKRNPVNKIKRIIITQWKQCFDSLWPLILPVDNIEQFWCKRFEFLSLLNMINPRQYQTSRFIKDYFILKKLSNHPLTRNESLEFLKLTIIDIGMNNGKGLLTCNNIISQVLPLYDDNTLQISTDPELVNLFLQTLVNNNKNKLNSLYSFIEYILKDTNNQPNYDIIVAILRSLAQAKNWNEYFNFWENKLYNITIGNDYRPWEQFIQYVVETKDQHLMYQLIKDDHLLWLKRYQVPITPGIRRQITILFDTLDPQREQFRELESLLLNMQHYKTLP